VDAYATGSTVAALVACAAGGQSCAVTERLTTDETTRGGAPVAVSASRSPAALHTFIVVGAKHVPIGPGWSATVHVRLNQAGRWLLARFRRLPVTLDITNNTGTLFTPVLERKLRLHATQSR
jgi:hypothetical protein